MNTSFYKTYPAIYDHLKSIPKPDVKFIYGTAGFRMHYDLLPSVFIRVGIIGVLRSMYHKQAIGLMVTASHNPEIDNGIKIVDPDGGMMSLDWEKFATDLTNSDPDAALELIDAFVAEKKIDLSFHPVVITGRDTRKSGKYLLDLAIKSAEIMHAEVMNLEEVTTPLLHHVVRQYNDPASQYKGVDGYYRMLGEGFAKVIRGFESVARAHDPLYVDCANGAGQLVLPGLQRVCGDLLKLEGFNMSRENLNNLAGANYLYTQRAIPTGFTAETARGKRLCSLDGDADRLLYWRVDPKDDSLDIMDGDKEMSLAALWVRKQVDELGLEDVTIGAVKTAYANGASVVYAKENGIPVAMAKTGVKYLHPLAAANDVGTYFEANGHGTVLFKKSFVQRLQALDGSKLTATQEAARERLLWASVLVNQAVGDALSDALFLEAAMITMDISLEQFSHLYENLPCINTVVKVEDRTIIKCNGDETQCVAPETIQPLIDQIVAKIPKGRSFVRPSGTENVVRVYAEADTMEHAKELSKTVERIVFDCAKGVGERPWCVCYKQSIRRPPWEVLTVTRDTRRSGTGSVCPSQCRRQVRSSSDSKQRCWRCRWSQVTRTTLASPPCAYVEPPVHLPIDVEEDRLEAALLLHVPADRSCLPRLP